MRMFTWLHADPRGKLVVAFLIALVLVVMAVAAPTPDAYETRLWVGIIYVWAVLTPVNGWVLRKRHRSLRWLLFQPFGILAFIPVAVALLASPGRQKDPLPQA